MKPQNLIPVIGVDVGQRRDPTAIAVAEIELRASADSMRRPRCEAHYLVRFLGRLPLGTPYPEVALRIAKICGQVAARSGREPVVFIDATGVGLPVLDQLRASKPIAKRIDAVLFTAGRRRIEKPAAGRVMLGKEYLVSRLQSLLQCERLHLPETAEASILALELRNFEIRVDAKARQRSGAFRVGTHDDLVIALGLAVHKEPVQDPSTLGFVL